MLQSHNNVEINRGVLDSQLEQNTPTVGPTVVNPKPWASNQHTPNDWFRFYAGFNHEFASRILASVTKKQHVVDPWNGSGASTVAAAVAGIKCSGFDLNPAMVVVARSRLAGPNVVAKALHEFTRLNPRQLRLKEATVQQDDPLLQWLSPTSVRAIRIVERDIGIALQKSPDLSRRALLQVATNSPLGCVLYVALFLTVRELVEGLRSTNPTWLQVPPPSARLRPTEDRVRRLFSETLEKMKVASLVEPVAPKEHRVTASWASSTALPLDDQSVDCVVTSPPYCTRLDYAVATATDLAVLGVGGDTYRSVRRALMGTTTVPHSAMRVPDAWGQVCTALLQDVQAHTSKASRTYYTKSLLQYFDGLHRSIGELGRVVKDDGCCYVVVQDSYYKEIHVDLPTIVVEMALRCGFEFESSWNFLHSRTYSGLNPHTKQYRVRHRPQESVLQLKRIRR